MALLLNNETYQLTTYIVNSGYSVYAYAFTLWMLIEACFFPYYYYLFIKVLFLLVECDLSTDSSKRYDEANLISDLTSVVHLLPLLFISAMHGTMTSDTLQSVKKAG